MRDRCVFRTRLPAVLSVGLICVLAWADETPDRQTERGGGGLSGVWTQQGPAPATGGQVENLIPDNEVVGAIEAIVPHPTDADVIYIGGTNAGIWKTGNGTDSSPSWTNLTDGFESLSIGSLDMDPTDPSHQTLVAGMGRFSSYGRQGGPRIGFLRTTDGGGTWAVLNGGGSMVGRNVAAVAARGSTIVAAVNTADTYSYPNIGLFRSTDGGASFTQMSNGDGSATGLPGGVAHDLGRDRDHPERLFTSIIFAGGAGGTNGVYRSTNTGETWTKVSTAAMDTLIDDDVSNLEFSISGDVVLVGIVRSGRLAGVFRSPDGGSSWTAMDLPQTIEDGVAVGVHPGGQGAIHFSIQADPTNGDIVYIGGDRQPYWSEASGGSGFWPNSVGAFDYSGRLFRGDFSQPTGSQWVPLTHTGTASSSSPHADSREMAFDVNGHLLEVDDGGIYRRTQPRSATGDWFSINGDLASTEYHGIAYDSVSKVIVGGAQDTGTTEQLLTDGATFRSVSTGDGGDVAVDDISSPIQSTRFTSFQFLSAFRRRVVDAANSPISLTFPSLSVLGGGPSLQALLYSPIAINADDGNRLLIGADNAVYESLDQGDTVTAIGLGIRINPYVGDPVVYGVPGNADLIYVAAGASLYQRTAAPPAAMAEVTSPTANLISGLTVDPFSPDNIFAVDAAAVFHSTNAASIWTNVTGNLASFNPGRLRTLEFVPGSNNAVLVGTDRGIFVAYASSGYSEWARLGGANFPNAPVFELDYSAVDDVLVVGLLGRGAWKFVDATDLIFADRYE